MSGRIQDQIDRALACGVAVEPRRPPKPCRRCGVPMEDRHRWYCDSCRVVVARGKLKKRGPRPAYEASMAERGYGREHVKLRRRVARAVEAGCVRCARCGGLIAPGEPWDLGHDDEDRSRYAGPEHRGCNRATAAHRKQRRQINVVV